MNETILEAIKQLNKQDKEIEKVKLIEKYSNFDKLNFLYLFEECRDNIIQLYPIYKEDLKSIGEPEFSNSINKWGETGRITHVDISKHIVTYKFNLKFSTLILGKEFKDIAINVIYHELAHCVTALILRNSFNMNLIKDENVFRNQVDKDGGHNNEWFEVINNLNMQLNLKYPLQQYVSLTESHYMVEQKNLKELLKIHCSNCNHSIIVYQDDESLESHIISNFYLYRFLLAFGFTKFHPKLCTNLGKNFQDSLDKLLHICNKCKSDNCLDIKVNAIVQKYSKHLVNNFIKTNLREINVK